MAVLNHNWLAGLFDGSIDSHQVGLGAAPIEFPSIKVHLVQECHVCLDLLSKLLAARLGVVRTDTVISIFWIHRKSNRV